MWSAFLSKGEEKWIKSPRHGICLCGGPGVRGATNESNLTTVDCHQAVLNRKNG